MVHKTTLTAIIGLMITLVAGLLLTGCGKSEIKVDSEGQMQPDGQIWGQVWVRIPTGNTDGYRLVGDSGQDIVSLEHPQGRMALPDRIDPGEIWVNGMMLGVKGSVPVAVYHLCLKDGTEVDYYKRRFARTLNQ